MPKTTKNCVNCYFWSEMLAQAVGGKPVEAMCLNDNSNYHRKMRFGNNSCDDFEHGDGTTIDSPY